MFLYHRTLLQISTHTCVCVCAQIIHKAFFFPIKETFINYLLDVKYHSSNGVDWRTNETRILPL